MLREVTTSSFTSMSACAKYGAQRRFALAEIPFPNQDCGRLGVLLISDVKIAPTPEASAKCATQEAVDISHLDRLGRNRPFAGHSVTE